MDKTEKLFIAAKHSVKKGKPGRVDGAAVVCGAGRLDWNVEHFLESAGLKSLLEAQMRCKKQLERLR